MNGKHINEHDGFQLPSVYVFSWVAVLVESSLTDCHPRGCKAALSGSGLKWRVRRHGGIGLLLLMLQL